MPLVWAGDEKMSTTEAKYIIYRREGSDLYSEGIYESVRAAMDDYERRLEQRQLKSGIKNMYFLVNLALFARGAIKLNPADFRLYKKERDRVGGWPNETN